MVHIDSKIKTRLIISLVIIAIFAVGSYIGVRAAYSGTVYGRSNLNGYFTNDYYSGNNGKSVLPEVYSDCPDGLSLCAIPNYVESIGSTGEPNTLMGLLYNAYTNNSSAYTGSAQITQARVGAAFVVNTMLGRNAPGNGTTISAGDWSQLSTFLNSYNINWHQAGLSNNDGTNCINSLYFSGPDDAFYSNSSSCHSDRTGINITDSDGATVYRLWRKCANPVGKQRPNVWYVAPTAWVYSINGNISNTTTANIGDTIVWKYKVTVNMQAIDKTVNYGYDNTGGGTFNSSVSKGNLAIGTAVGGGSGEYSQTHNVTASSFDAGKRLCSAAYVNPAASNNNSKQDSAVACVDINVPPPPTPNACRPIEYKTNTSTLWDVHNSRKIPTSISVRNDSTGATYNYGPYYYDSQQTINLTTRCTTGDTWTITETSSSYIYYHYDYTYSCGTVLAPKTCTGHNDQYRSYSRTTSIGPCYDYLLNSSVNDFFARLEPGSSITLLPSINSKSYTQTGIPSFYSLYGTHTKSKSTEWRITKMVIAPSATATPSTPPSAVAGSTTGAYGMSFCGRFDPTNKSTCSTFNGTTVFDVNGNPSSSINYNFTVPDVPAGTKICFAFSIYPSQSDSPNTSSSWGSNLWNHATYDPARNCIIVVKKPKTQIWGGDLWTKSSVDASNSVKSGYRFGSWDEYGILASGSISGIASGSAFAGASGLSAGSICNYSTLTFTNGANAACSNLGSYTSAHTIPSVEANFPGGTAITSSSITVDSYFHN